MVTKSRSVSVTDTEELAEGYLAIVVLCVYRSCRPYSTVIRSTLYIVISRCVNLGGRGEGMGRLVYPALCLRVCSSPSVCALHAVALKQALKALCYVYCFDIRAWRRLLMLTRQTLDALSSEVVCIMSKPGPTLTAVSCHSQYRCHPDLVWLATSRVF